MAATPTPNTVSADVAAAEAEAKAKADAVAADAEADAKAKAESLLAEAEAEVKHAYVAVKDFTARHLTQLLVFKKGDELDSNVGSALAAKGAPVRPVE